MRNNGGNEKKTLVMGLILGLVLISFLPHLLEKNPTNPKPPKRVLEVVKMKEPEPEPEPEPEVRNASRVMYLEATAYTHAQPGGCINGTGDGLTALGIPVREGVVAVDPNVIPLGTELYIEGYGNALAADTGGAIRGNKIDLFFSTNSRAMQFGRRTVRVEIID